MTTKKTATAKIQFKPETRALIDKFKKAGFNCYAYETGEKLSTNFVLEKNGLAYIQESYFSGWNLGTKHKPCTEFGTGFGMLDNVLDISPCDVEHAIKTIAPNWSRSENHGKIQKYEDFDDYLKKETILKYHKI